MFGPKIIATREPFQDRALESRFLTEETGTRPLRADIPIHLPKEMKAEALALRNRLLHFRLCEFFTIKTDTTALMDGVEPRLNQTALSLLSLVDDRTLRAAIQRHLMNENAASVEERQDIPEARVLSAVLAAFEGATGTSVSVREISERFNISHCAEYGSPMSYRWIGEVLRTRLHLQTRKSNGIYVIPMSERGKLGTLAYKYRIGPSV